MSLSQDDSRVTPSNDGKVNHPDEDALGIDDEEEKAANEELDLHSEFLGSSLIETFDKISEALSDKPEQIQHIVQVISTVPYFPRSLKDAYTESVEKLIKCCQLEAGEVNDNAVESRSDNAVKSLSNNAVESLSNNHVNSLSDNAVESLSDLLDELTVEQRESVNKVDNEETQLSIASCFKKTNQKAEMEKQEKEIAEQKAGIAEQKAGIAEQKAEIISCLSNMRNEAHKTLVNLQFLSGMTQAETSATGDTTDAMDRYGSIIMQGHDVGGGVPVEVDRLLKNPGKLVLEELLKDHEAEKSESTDKKLTQIVRVWESLVTKSTILDNEDKKVASKIEKSIRWMKEALTAEAPTAEEKADDDQPKLVFPGMVGGEVAASQPTLMGLLELIGDGWNDDDFVELNSPRKTQVKKNQIVPRLEVRNKRVADLCIDKPGRFHLVMVDIAIKLLFEMKPLLRKDVGPDKLDRESLEQGVSHLAKFMAQCFNFLGCGTSSYATGLTGTLAYVKVVRLHLDFKDASTEGEGMTKLGLSVSDRLPLMSKKRFEKWVEECKPKGGYSTFIKDKLGKLITSMYGEEGDRGTDELGIPIGIRVLWELMSCRRKTLFGPNYESMFQNNNDDDEIESLIASGTYGNVFALKGRQSVLKVPAFFSRSYYIECEERALIGLNRKKEKTDEIALPVLEAVKKVRFNLGGVITAPVSALQLAPRGTPIKVHLGKLTNQEFDMAGFIDKTMTSMENALNVVHKHRWLHLDVSSENLVVEDGTDRVILIDFSCAKQIGRVLKGFVGTPSFAHQDLFRSYPGAELQLDDTHTKFDFCSLALTLCTLTKRGRTTWDMHGFPHSLRDKSDRNALHEKLSERGGKARNIIETTRSRKKEKWLRWLDWEVEPKKRIKTKQRARPQKRRKTPTD